MHDAPFEGAEIEARIVGLVVIVIARSEIEPVGRQVLAIAIIGFDRDVPAGVRLAPVGGDDGVAGADVLADAAFVHDAVEIVEDGWPVGDGFLVPPGFEIEAERVHVAVRADAGIAEQVPGPAQIGAAFENGVAVIWRLVLHVGGHADPGNPRSYDQDIEIGLLCRACHVVLSHSP